MYAVYQNSYNHNSSRITPTFETRDQAERFMRDYCMNFANLEVKPFQREQFKPPKMELPERDIREIRKKIWKHRLKQTKGRGKTS